MCGLLGILSHRDDQHVDLGPLLRLIEHRGPDDDGCYEDAEGGLQLGFRRLAIIDLETGEQPVSNEDKSVVVVLNGEIYNYIELTRELKRRGHCFRSHGDAEVLVHLYEEKGDELLHDLQGMFAFALWDSRRRRLLIARDHAGIKPLYYVQDGERIAFASEIKPLLRMPGASREIDPAAVEQYLTFGYTIAPITIFRDIHKLRPGCKLVVEDGVIAESEYWNLRSPAPVGGRVQNIRRRVLDEFDDAVRLHLRSDVAVGAFLSGGIDSGLMVARAAHLHPRLRTYTLRFENGRVDESELARLVAERYGTDHRTFTVSVDSMKTLIPAIVWACDEPLGDSGLLPNYVISRLAHDDGVKVVLNGAGGDELFAGYTHFFATAVEKRLNSMHVPLGAAARLFSPISFELSRKLVRAQSYRTDPAKHYLGHVTVWPERELNRILDRNERPEDPAKPRLDFMTEFRGDELNSKLYAESRTYLVDDLMLLLDRMTMIHSLEGRVPYLHRPFMELVMGIPGEVKAPGGERKALLRSIAAEFLPEPLLHQPKSGFSSPIREWMTGEFGGMVTSILSQERTLQRPWWNPRALRSFIRSPEARRGLHHRLFLLFILEIFCRIHVDAAYDSPATVPSRVDLL